MPEFLVRISINTGNTEEDTVAGLRLAEARRASELAASGHLVRLWRASGERAWSNIGVWRAPDEPSLERLLDSLPLRPYMTIHVEKLSTHPSDPGSPSADHPTDVIA